LALACSAVSYSLIYHPWANNYLGQMKHALMHWKDGAITISAVQDACGANCSIKLKAKENKSMGKKMTTYAAFSGTHWKDNTNKFLKSIMALSTEDMDVITDLAKVAAKKAMRAEGKALVLTIDNDDNDDNGILCNGSESSEHEDEGGAQALQWKSHHMFLDFLLHYMVSNMVFKLPKQGDQQPPLILMKSEFIIKTSIGRTIPT
jgi:3-oxoacyl-(acyl-carrier-protein) synthase